MVAAISSIIFLSRRSFFFIPICNMASLAIFELARDRIQREQEAELANSQRAYQDFKF